MDAISPSPEEISLALAAVPPREIALDGFLPAAVALPLVRTARGLCILLTVRTAHVEQHKGEISFPGGRVEPEDEGTLQAALRETWEEVGIYPDDLAVLGALDDAVSVTGYRVTPYVVYLDRRDYPFAPAPREVAEILLVPLDHLLDATNYRSSAGPERRMHYFHWGPYVVWGLTASVLRRLLEVAFGFRGEP